MSATDALTITSALDALTRYYDAKEREESAVLYINDAYLEALNSLEKLEAENAKLRDELDAAKHDLSLFSERIVELGAENAKLRETLHRRTEHLKGMADMWVERGVENAKLQELARHMHTCMEHYEMDGTISCDRCPLDNDVGNCDFERRMRELGVVE